MRTLGRAQLRCQRKELTEGESKRLKFSPPVSLTLDSPLSEGAKYGFARRASSATGSARLCSLGMTKLEGFCQTAGGQSRPPLQAILNGRFPAERRTEQEGDAL